MVKYEDGIYPYLEDFPFEIDLFKPLPKEVVSVAFEYHLVEKIERGKILFLDKDKNLVKNIHLMGTKEDIKKIEEAYSRFFTHH